MLLIVHMITDTTLTLKLPWPSLAGQSQSKAEQGQVHSCRINTQGSQLVFGRSHTWTTTKMCYLRQLSPGICVNVEFMYFVFTGESYIRQLRPLCDVFQALFNSLVHLFKPGSGSECVVAVWTGRCMQATSFLILFIILTHRCVVLHGLSLFPG